jgi:amino acid adenylation domain-containing protein
MTKEQLAQRRAKLADRRAALSLEEVQQLEQRRQGTASQQPQPTLPRAARDGTLPLSFAQERLWFLDQLAPGSAAYNIPSALRLQGTLDVAALEHSLNEIVRRHEAPRTIFALHDEHPIQVITPAAPQTLPPVDLSDLPVTEREARARQIIAEDARRPFDLAHGPLWRAVLLRLDEHDHILLVTLHHIISDGWSIGVLIRELTALYRAFKAGQPSPLPELPVQYVDYAIWQRQWLSGDALAQQLAYWQQQFSGELPALDLPSDRPRPPVQTFRGATHTFQVPLALTQQLLALSHEAGATLFMTLLAAFQTLLHRYTGQTDLIIGTPIANRTRLEIEDLIGFFVNTLALRVNLSGKPTFRELLTQVREVTLGAYAHQDVPFDRLVDELHVPRDLSRTPLFQVMFALQNAPMPAIELPDLHLLPLEAEGATAKFDLTLSLIETADGLQGLFEYNTDLFESATIVRMTIHLLTLLNSLVQRPDVRLSDLALLTAAEQHQLLVEWNATRTDEPREQKVHELVEAQATQTPDTVAVVCEDEHITYGALNQWANQVAHHLHTIGVRPEALIGICLERSVEMIVGVLGILKAGGAYIPLDPAYPPERLAFMLNDSGALVLLTQTALVDLFTDVTAQIVTLPLAEGSVNDASLTFPQVTDQNLAYVIYTSGSTGKPKGVLIQHRSLMNLVQWHQRAFDVSAADHATQLAGWSFDASVWEIWPYLTRGATLHLPDEETRLSPEQLRSWLNAEHITIGFVPTPLAEKMLVLPWPSASSFRTMLTGGDQLHERPQRGTPFALINNYGPTESTVVATSTRITADDPAERMPPIGRPIANAQIYLLDAGLNPTPIGVPGEVYIGGEGLARGYLHRPALTAEKFIPDPFSAQAGRRLYRTGDLARYLPEGQIEFLGRIDQQVKLRGFRIELGEIEATLNQHSTIQQSAVIVREEANGDKRLVAYVVTTDNSLPVSELRQFLQERLPYYMLPAAFVRLVALPLTPNGKLDRKALPDPDRSAAEQESYVAPRTPLEQELAAIWIDILHLERVGIHDNFFAVGGHSLLATQIMTRITQRYQVALPLQALFQTPTIAVLAEKIEMIRWAAQDQAGLTSSDQTAREEGEL